MAAYRPLPRLNPENSFFWTGGSDGKLRFLQCQDCRTFVHPPRPVCPKCRSEAVSPAVVAGTGVIDTYTINYQKWQPTLETPYVIARVAIDGAPGVYLTTNIVGCPVEAVDIGDRVKVAFQQHEDIWLPLFEKV